MGISAPATVASRRRVASESAIVALIVFLIALVGIGIGQAAVWTSAPASPGSTTVVTNPPTTKSTTETETASTPTPSVGNKQSQETVTGGEVTTTVTPTEDTSFFGRVFANPASVLLLQALVALLVGFLFGAVWQRVRLGEYGITLGPVALPSLSPISEDVAAPVVAPITAEDVRRTGIPVLPVKEPAERWWHNIPTIDVSDSTLKQQRIGMEAATRELAFIRQVPAWGLFRDVVWALLDNAMPPEIFSSQFGAGLIGLVDLGDRVLENAPVEDSARILLAAANNHALNVIFSYLPPAGWSDQGPPTDPNQAELSTDA